MNLRPSSSFHQHGATLPVVLILLLVMTVLGLAAMRGTLMEDRMSANLLDRGVGFQAAEAALREGEAIAATEPVAPGSGCTDGVCALPASGDVDRWLDSSFNGWRTASSSLGSLAVQPKFIVEYIGEAPSWPGCNRAIPTPALCMRSRYRITAISAEDGRAHVLLQTNYIVQ